MAALNSQNRLPDDHRKGLEDYRDQLLRAGKPVPGLQSGELTAVHWGGVARDTGLDEKLLIEHASEARSILEPAIAKLGVAQAATPPSDEELVARAREYAAALLAAGKGLPARERRGQHVISWRTIAEESQIPYHLLNKHQRIIRPFLDQVVQETGFRNIAPPTPAQSKQQPSGEEIVTRRVNEYLMRLIGAGRGVPVRCRNLEVAINWVELCKEFDCAVLTTSSRRELAARLLLEATSKVGARFGSKEESTLCEQAFAIRRVLEKADVEKLRSALSEYGRLRWRVIADLIGVPEKDLEPNRLRLRAAASAIIEKRLREHQENEDAEKIFAALAKTFGRSRDERRILTAARRGRLDPRTLAAASGLDVEVVERYWPWLKRCLELRLEAE